MESVSSELHESYDEDCGDRGEGRPADYVVTLHNLDLQAIRQRWREIRYKNYKLSKNNCCSVVINCLRAGSGIKPAIEGKNTGLGIIGDIAGTWTPEDVLDYAKQLQRKIG